MNLPRGLAGLALAACVAFHSTAMAQQRAYIGYAYPAGARQGTTVHVKLGGQNLEGVDKVLVTGQGVEARVLSYQRRLGAQENQLLREQLQELRKQVPRQAREASESLDLSTAPSTPGDGDAPAAFLDRIERRLAEYVQTPACTSISNLVWIELAVSTEAPPGPRELRLATSRGVTNPLVFHVGQLPEQSRAPMVSAPLQVLGKEEAALRRRPEEQVEQRFTLPCTLNGQIASGEVNRYRFEARKGQRLVITTEARQLIPYIADAVPGWFQPVITLHAASGEELAYNDDYRFNPDPTLLFEVPDDGEYVLSINDALFRGREDFVYRLSVGELPFITSSFPLGGPASSISSVEIKGWNLEGSTLVAPSDDAKPGVVALHSVRAGVASNRVPFVVDTLPEAIDTEPNDVAGTPQSICRPVIVNGRMDHHEDRDVFAFEGKAGEDVVVEVQARRLSSPLDSQLWISDATGAIIAFNDDCEDLGAGVNTHHADSYLLTELPSDGTYRVHLRDAAGGSGDAYAYRLRIGPPRPDFELRAVPSSLAVRGKSAAPLDIHVIRKDGFTGPITLALKDPPEGFSAPAVTLPPDKPLVRLNVRTTLAATDEPVTLHVVGSAEIEGRSVAHAAIPAEDRMQAFLWRHLVPSETLQVLVYDPKTDPLAVRFRRARNPKP